MTDHYGLNSGDQILVYIFNCAMLTQTEFKIVNLCKALEHNKHSVNVS